MDKESKIKSYDESRKGFSSTARKMEKEGFGGRVSPTGYTDTLIGMDDIDKLRRIKIDKQVNR